MIDTLIATTVGTLITTTILWFVIRSSKKPRDPRKKYLLPLSIVVLVLVVVGYLVSIDAMSLTTGLGAVAIVGIFAWMLVDARRLE